VNFHFLEISTRNRLGTRETKGGNERGIKVTGRQGEHGFGTFRGAHWKRKKGGCIRAVKNSGAMPFTETRRSLGLESLIEIRG